MSLLKIAVIVGVVVAASLIGAMFVLSPTQANPNDLPAVVEAAVKKAKPSS